MERSRPKKQPSSQDRYEMDLMAEVELSKLLRQYRIMEGDRAALSEHTRLQLAKQNRLIKHLRDEHHNLNKELNVAAGPANRKDDQRKTLRFGELLRKFEDVSDHVDKGKSEISEIDQQIRKMDRRLNQLRSNEIDDCTYQQRISCGRKTLESLENRLDTAVKHFCDVLARNQQLRNEMDHLLKERARFNESWQKLLANLDAGKKFTLDMIEQATLAYDQREEWCSKLQALRQRARADLTLHTHEMRELKRKLDCDASLQQFLNIKGQRRVPKDLEEKERRLRQAERAQMERQLAVYYDTLDRIVEFTGEKSPHKLASHFVKQEEENFALFNYVNELQHELETIAGTIDDLRQSIEQQKETNQQRALQQKDTIDQLNAQLSEAEKQAQKQERNLTDKKTTLGNILSGISQLFAAVGCDNTSILELLGDNTAITDCNAMLYLGLLERRVADLMTTAYFSEKNVKKKHRAKADKDVALLSVP